MGIEDIFQGAEGEVTITVTKTRDGRWVAQVLALKGDTHSRGEARTIYEAIENAAQSYWEAGADRLRKALEKKRNQ